MRERNPLDTEVSIDDQVTTQDFSRHDLTLFSINDLLPRVSGIWHNEAEIKAELFNHLPMHRHYLSY